jgi:hypothetical protein
VASASALRVPASVPLHPSLALLASLSAIAIDAAMRKQPFNPDPVAELARVLNQRVSAAPNVMGAATKLLDPEITGLLTEVLQTEEHTVEGLAREGAQIVAALQQPLDQKGDVALRQLRDFAMRLSAAAQHEESGDSSLRSRPLGM